MYKGIYIALSGAVLKQLQIDVISQNLANAGTAGYKKDILSFKDYLMPQDLTMPQPDGRAMSYLGAFKTDFSVGDLIKTGNALDIAIDGNGFIALEGDRYTKRGDLKRDKEGYLTTHNNIKVLGSNGPVKLPTGKIEISESGDIFVNGIQVDTLKIVGFENTDNLKKMGDGIFTTTENGIKSNAAVKQGYLETSNVDVIKEMVRMIETLREFEAYQKAIHALDEAIAKASNEILRI